MLIRNVLLDLDGTLFDTQTFHAQAESELALHYGVRISPEELTERYAGRATEEVFAEVLSCGLEIGKELARKKWSGILPRAAEAKPLFDIPKLLEALEERDIGFGIGTASPSEWAWSLIGRHGLEAFFDRSNVIGGDMILKGKPDPEIWIRLARQIGAGLAPDRFLVVEDGIAGIKGATAAGMRSALILPKTHPNAAPIMAADEILKMLD